MINAIDRQFSPRHAAYGIALLRVSLGVMLIAHSVILKYQVYTLAGTAAYFESIGFPGFSAYLVFWLEALAGVALVLGAGTRLASLAVLPVLVGALWVHAGNGWVFSMPNGGWEYPLYLTVLAVAQILLGPGALALESRQPRVAAVDGHPVTR
ncbi:MAG TPA: DoxX family protein [Gammaproteobacteria bacterium]|nr:DoxX family protein [Gammaproteobacteria bacterium]